jgi:hypothetical protein
LTVIGEPEIEVEPLAIDFEPVLIGADATEAIVVRNAGTDLLLVTNVAAEPGDYGVDDAQFIVAPGESAVVSVAFAPAAPGPVPGGVTIASNDADEPSVVVALSGTGIEPPVISVSPGSLAASLVSGEIAMQTLTIANVGASDLAWEIHLEPPTVLRSGSGDLAGKRILYDRSHGQGPIAGWSTVVGSLEARGAEVVESFDPVTAELLAGYDVLWTVDVGSAWTAAQAADVAQWLGEGGGLLLEGDGNTSVTSFNLLLSTAGIGIESARLRAESVPSGDRAPLRAAGRGARDARDLRRGRTGAWRLL